MVLWHFFWRSFAVNVHSYGLSYEDLTVSLGQFCTEVIPIHKMNL